MHWTEELTIKYKPFKDAIQEIENRHITFLKSKETIYQKFGNRLSDHFIAIDGIFRWHTWTDLTQDIKQEVEACYLKFFNEPADISHFTSKIIK